MFWRLKCRPADRASLSPELGSTNKNAQHAVLSFVCKAIDWTDVVPITGTRVAFRDLENHYQAVTAKEEAMSAVLLAIFNEHKVADRVRVELVRDGFPTDRVELTAGCEPGRAGLEPADSAHGRLVQYFRVLFSFEDERHYAEQLAERIDNGNAIIAVHPRGSMEIRRATQILASGGAMQIMSHDLANPSPGSSLSKRARPWILGALAIALLLTGYRVTSSESEEVGLARAQWKLPLKSAETVPYEIDLRDAGCLPGRKLGAVIAHYFDTHLPLEEFYFGAEGDRYTTIDNGDFPSWGC